MLASNIIIGIGLVAVFGGALIIAWRRRDRNLFSVLFVVGIAALAAAVTIVRVDQYQAQKAEASQVAKSQPAQPMAASGSSVEPTAKPPIGLPILPPMVRGPSGAAAPPAVHSPYAGNP
jgi:thiol:disulfide interchange protein